MENFKLHIFIIHSNYSLELHDKEIPSVKKVTFVDDRGVLIIAGYEKDGVPLSCAPKAKGQAAHATFLFLILHQKIYIAVTIEIL
ncbi:hypothetical protein N9R00_01985 [Flavobacteriaceae bacterium]|nr:hypothetical protein [Flavobacteriaceae bacterium]